MIIVILDNTVTNQDKKYDLIERTFLFAKSIRDFVDKLPKKATNIEIGRQLVKSGGSVGSDFIEADGSTQLIKIFSTIIKRATE